MFYLARPLHDEIRTSLAWQAEQELSYEPVGLTRPEAAQPPAPWRVDRHRVLLGAGEHTYRRAREAICQWKMFPAPLAEVFWPNAPEVGQTVGVLLRSSPLWLLCACRIVEVFDEPVSSRSGVARYGFTYGSLPQHIARGEERFEVTWHRHTDEVAYELTCVSCPNHTLARLGRPMMTWQQARFRRLSGEAMKRATQAEVVAATQVPA